MWTEYVGYVGSVLVAVSLTMSNIRNLRIVNLFGASTFATYGFFIHSYPVMFLNSFIVLTDIYYLIRMFTQKDYFNINDTLTKDDFFVHKFLNYHHIEVESFFPNFHLHKIENPHIILVSRNLRPVGLFIYEEMNDGIIQIHLDFATKEYRDTKNVRYIFMTKTDELKARGFHTFRVKNGIKKHQKYLKKIGFKKTEENIYMRKI